MEDLRFRADRVGRLLGAGDGWSYHVADDVEERVEEVRRIIPILPDVDADDLAEWDALVERVAEATVRRVDEERHLVRWVTADGASVEDQHVSRAAKIACDLLIGRRRMPPGLDD